MHHLPGHPEPLELGVPCGAEKRPGEAERNQEAAEAEARMHVAQEGEREEEIGA